MPCGIPLPRTFCKAAAICVVAGTCGPRLALHHPIYTAMDTRQLLETYSKAHPRAKS
jgi:hypothetical protein